MFTSVDHIKILIKTFKYFVFFEISPVKVRFINIILSIYLFNRVASRADYGFVLNTCYFRHMSNFMTKVEMFTVTLFFMDQSGYPCLISSKFNII